MDLRLEIQGAFQEIVLPQIQKDLSAIKEDFQDMRRDLQLLSENSRRSSGECRGSTWNTRSGDASPRSGESRGSTFNTNALDATCCPQRDTFMSSANGNCEVTRPGRPSSTSWASRAMRKKSSAAVPGGLPGVPNPAAGFTGRNTIGHGGSPDRSPPPVRASQNGGSWASRAMRKKGSRGHALEPQQVRQLALPSYIAEGNGEDKEDAKKDDVDVLSNRFTFVVPQPLSVDQAKRALPPGRASILGRTSIREDDLVRVSRMSNQSLAYAESTTSGSNANGHAPRIQRLSQRSGERLVRAKTRKSMAAGKVSLALARTSEFNRKESLWEWMSSLTQAETWRGLSAKSMLQSSRFDNLISFLILANSLTIGLEADYAAQNITEAAPWPYRVFEVFFCAVFTCEISLRVWAYKKSFFLKRDQSVLWNYFDLLVVAAQLVQEAIEFFRPSSEGNDADNLRILRVLRVLRIVRIFRLVRVLHLIGELRTIVSSIMGSFRSLFWTVILLLLLMYIVGVWFLQSVTDHFVQQRGDEGGGGALSSGEDQLRKHFDSLARTILSLWQALSGGVNWGEVANPLISEVQPLLGVAFAAYIAFALLALMNVVTGVFVQTALHSAEQEEESFLTSQIIQLFHKCKDDDSWGCITEQDLEERLDDPELAKEWKNISVSADEAHYVFALLDVDETGEVQFEEFLSACLRLKGNAKSLDMLIQLQESRHNTKVLEELFERLEDSVAGISASLQLLQSERCKSPQEPRSSSADAPGPRHSSRSGPTLSPGA